MVASRVAYFGLYNQNRPLSMVSCEQRHFVGIFCENRTIRETRKNVHGIYKMNLVARNKK